MSTAETVTIGLDQLQIDAANVRADRPANEIEALAASIRAHGLIHPLTVRANGKGYKVVAGFRRLQALKLIAKADKVKFADFPVDCTLVEADDRAARELSLAENVHRVDMNPVDAYEAFVGLADAGMTSADIARRYGVTERWVKQRLALGRLAAPIREAVRSGEMSLETATAYTLSNDHEAQMAVFDRYGPRVHPQTVRGDLRAADVRPQEAIAAFVGLDAYLAAGGTVREDLFSDHSTWSNAPLVRDLAMRKIEAELEAIRQAEGWGWVAAALAEPRFDGLAYVQPTIREVTPEERAEADRLNAELDDCGEKLEALTDSDDDGDKAEIADLDARYEAIQARLDAIENGQAALPAEIKARLGVLAWIQPNYGLRIERGYERIADRPKPADAAGDADAESGIEPNDVTGQVERDPATGEAVAASDAAEPEAEALTPYGRKVMEGLHRDKQVALACAVADQPRLAKAILAIQLWSRVSSTRTDSAASVHIIMGWCRLRPHNSDSDDSKNLAGLIDDFDHDLRGKTHDEALAWAMTAPEATVDRLIALCVALAIDPIGENPSYYKGEALSGFDTIADAAKLDMRSTWTASADWLGTLSKAQIADAVAEAKGPERVPGTGMKKADMAAAAARELAGTGWLPPALRTAATRSDTTD